MFFPYQPRRQASFFPLAFPRDSPKNRGQSASIGFSVKRTIFKSIFSIIAIAFTTVLAGPHGAFAKSPAEDPSVVRFRNAVEKHLDRACLRKRNFGVKIYSLDKKEPLYQFQNNQLFIPASNVKLITSAVALKKFGPDYRFSTELHSAGKIENNVLYGDLYIKGFGDPKLVSEQMWLLANEFHNLPITRVEGNVIADDSFFDDERRLKTWKKNYGAQAYNAPLSALSFNFNTVTVFAIPAKTPGEKPIVVVDPESDYIRVTNQATTLPSGRKGQLIVNRLEHDDFNEITLTGGIAHGSARARYFLNITDPTNYTAKIFKSFLIRAGVDVKGEIKTGKVPENAKLLVQHDSEPLSLIIQGLNKHSNNFIAEQLLKTLGAEEFGAPGTTENGAKIAQKYLQSLGYDPNTYTLVDGSGLSRSNRLSPDQFIAILENMQKDWGIYPEYIASLAVMGLDGSAGKRLNGHPEAQRVRVKTGTLDLVSALSGYFQSQGGERFAFSMLMNDVRCSHREVLSIQDNVITEGLKFERSGN